MSVYREIFESKTLNEGISEVVYAPVSPVVLDRVVRTNDLSALRGGAGDSVPLIRTLESSLLGRPFSRPSIVFELDGRALGHNHKGEPEDYFFKNTDIEPEEYPPRFRSQME